MHIELLVEDSSGHRLLDILLPQILGPQGQTHSWRVTSYKGLGRIPKNLTVKADPAKRILLDRLRQVLQGLGKTPGIDAVVIVIDADKRDLTHEWAAKIGPLMAIDENASPSFGKFRDGLRRLAG